MLNVYMKSHFDFVNVMADISLDSACVIKHVATGSLWVGMHV